MAEVAERAMPAYAGRAGLCFGLTMLALWLVFHAVFELWFADSALFSHWLAFDASAGSALLRAIGIDVAANGAQLDSKSASMTVMSGCAALPPFALFTCGVLAYRARWSSKAAVVVAGLAIAGVLNVLRVASLFWLRSSHPWAFQPAHMALWPAALVIIAVVGWFAWASKTR